MSRQAAVDIACEGKINKGNLEAVLGMPEQDQVITLAAALQFSGKILGAMERIGEHVEKNKSELIDSQPGLLHSIEALEKQLLLEDNEKDIQRADQPKVDGESI